MVHLYTFENWFEPLKMLPPIMRPLSVALMVARHPAPCPYRSQLSSVHQRNPFAQPPDERVPYVHRITFECSTVARLLQILHILAYIIWQSLKWIYVRILNLEQIFDNISCLVSGFLPPAASRFAAAHSRISECAYHPAQNKHAQSAFPRSYRRIFQSTTLARNCASIARTDGRRMCCVYKWTGLGRCWPVRAAGWWMFCCTRSKNTPLSVRVQCERLDANDFIPATLYAMGSVQMRCHISCSMLPKMMAPDVGTGTGSHTRQRALSPSRSGSERRTQ